jgi:hypothetical protein
MTFMTKSRADRIQGMLAIIQSKIFCLPISYKKTEDLIQKKIVILPFVLYGCETWSLTLREEHRLRVSEKSVLRRIFGFKMEEDGSWRKLHNDELQSLYSSLNIVSFLFFFLKRHLQSFTDLWPTPMGFSI